MMALRVGSPRPPSLLRPRVFLGWGGALAVGLAAVSCKWRSIAGGDVRIRPTLIAFRCFRSQTSTRTLSSSTSTINPIFSLSGISSNIAMSLIAPQPPPAWDHSAEDLTRLTKELIANDRALQDKVGALDPKDCNFSSVNNMDLLPTVSY